MTSSAAPSPSATCNTGDTDIDLASGEVYNCVSSAWSDSTFSIQGAAGQNGKDGKDGTNVAPEFTWTFTCQQSGDCGDEASATSIPAGTVLTPVAISATGGCADVITDVVITDRSANQLALASIGSAFTTPHVQLEGPDTTSVAGPLFMNFDTDGATCDQPVTVTFTFDETQSFS